MPDTDDEGSVADNASDAGGGVGGVGLSANGYGDGYAGRYNDGEEKVRFSIGGQIGQRDFLKRRRRHRKKIS